MIVRAVWAVTCGRYVRELSERHCGESGVALSTTIGSRIQMRPAIHGPSHDHTMHNQFTAKPRHLRELLAAVRTE